MGDTAMMFSVETVATMKKEVGFYQDHMDEVFSNRSLNIDWDTFAHIERSDSLRVFSIRVPEIVGYAVWILHEDTHDKSNRVAICDCIYVKPEYRGHGLKFIKGCEEYLEGMGIMEIRMPAPEGSRLDDLLLRKGYRKLETIYYKDVKHGRKCFQSSKEDCEKTTKHS